MIAADWIRLIVELVVLFIGFASVIITLKNEVRHLWRELGRLDQSSTKAHERIDDLVCVGRHKGV